MNEQVAAYSALGKTAYGEDSVWENLRFAILDCESTGTDPHRDQLVSVGGIAFAGEELLLWDTFSAVVPVAYNTSAVTVHGITREEAAEGIPVTQLLPELLEWLGDSVIVGHHISHDLILLNRSLEDSFGAELWNWCLDTAEVYRLLRASSPTAVAEPARYSLDHLLETYKITPHDRHTALGDAFLTGMLFMKLIREARKGGLCSLEQLHCWRADKPFPF
jgi:DNA polymerase-3 subunit epsilon